MNVKKMTTLALFTALALVLSLIESALPPLAPIPGIKLGLANIITLIILLYFTPADAFCVLLARVILSSFFAGQAMSLLYSLSGGIFCFFAMLLTCHLLQKHYVPLISMVGGCFHNIGQVLVAFLITGVPGVFAYLPILLVSGILTGFFTGLCAHFCRRCLRHIPQKSL